MLPQDDRPPPAWLGDVSVGVDAWTQRAAPAVPDASDASGDTEAPRAGRRQSGGRQSGRRRRTAPADAVAPGPPADPEAVARKILLDQLTGQARTRQELSSKLAAKEIPEEVATLLLDRFEEVGLIDDEAFARSWVASRQPGKGLARRALAQELRRKGIDDQVAREVLDEIDPADEETSARILVRKKLRTLSRVDDTTATRRLVGMLGRKGYSGAMAYAVVRDELAAAGREEPEPEFD